MLPHLVSRGTRGVVLYSFTDLPATDAFEMASLPYGIIDEHGRPKPVAEAISRFAKTKPQTTQNRLDTFESDQVLEGFYEEPQTRLGELFQAFIRR
jgi:hypothetical protein